MFKECNWKKVFCLGEDGDNLDHFYEHCAVVDASILVIQDKGGSVFGGFVTDTWKICDHYYGGENCFLFSLTGGERKVFNWTKENRFFMLSNEDSIALGGGGNFGIYLDYDMIDGTSSPCSTFGSGILASDEDFETFQVELWDFQIF